jgi:hypothetical protein
MALLICGTFLIGAIVICALRQVTGFVGVAAPVAQPRTEATASPAALATASASPQPAAARGPSPARTRAAAPDAAKPPGRSQPAAAAPLDVNLSS